MLFRSGLGGYPLEDAATITVRTVRSELHAHPGMERVIFALRGAAAYAAFEHAVHEAEPVAANPTTGPGGHGPA